MNTKCIEAFSAVLTMVQLLTLLAELKCNIVKRVMLTRRQLTLSVFLGPRPPERVEVIP